MTTKRLARRMVVLWVFVALGTAILPAGVMAVAGLDLTGEQLEATVAFAGHGQVTIAFSCDEQGTSTFSFEATGIARGPYPGTFSATGGGTIGAQFFPPGQGVQKGPVESFDATFTIDSPAGRITGTTSIPTPDFLGGYCVTPSPGSPFSGINLYLPIARYSAQMDVAGSISSDTGGTLVGDHYVCGVQCGDEFDQTFTSDHPLGTPPGAPTNVTAAAGDGTASVSWNPPASDGGSPITGYRVTGVGPYPFGGPGSFVAGDLTTAVFYGLVDGADYTFTVTAENRYGTGPASVTSSMVTPQAGALAPQTTTATVSATGGTATTDPEATGPTPLDPITTSVTVPATAGGGSVTIAETAIGAAPAGYVFIGQQVDIVSTATTSASNPLVLVFRIDPSLVPADIFRNGVPISAACDPVGTATPTPCIASGAGTGQITVLTAAASQWNLGRLKYAFSGFFSPVDNQPIVNLAKAGSAIPVKFGLGGNRGLNVFATGFPKSQVVACDSSAQVDGIDQTVSPGAATLSFDAGTGRYQYAWKTDKAWTGTCRQLVMKLQDGTTQRATFKFN